MKRISILVCLVLFVSVLFVGCSVNEKDWQKAYAGLNSICTKAEYAAFLDTTTNFSFQTEKINEAIGNNQAYKELRTVYERIIDECFTSIKMVYHDFENKPTRLESNGKAIENSLKELNSNIEKFNAGAERFLKYKKSYEFIVQNSFEAMANLELAQLLVLKKQYAEFVRESLNLFEACKNYYAEAFHKQASLADDSISYYSLVSLQLNLKFNALNDALSFVVEEFDGVYNNEISQSLLGVGLQQKLDNLVLDKEGITAKAASVNAQSYQTYFNSLESIMTAQENERALVINTLVKYEYTEDDINAKQTDEAVKEARLAFVKKYITQSHKKECEAFGKLVDLFE